MFYLWRFTNVNGYLYTASGISSCLVVGYVASLVSPRSHADLQGLTIYTLHDGEDKSVAKGEKRTEP